MKLKQRLRLVIFKIFYKRLSISYYIDNYIKKPKILPGEHHFVAIFLVPLMIAICGRIPDYINPDGTKNIPGDIVFYDDNGNLLLSFEVKLYKDLNQTKFTKLQYKEWINTTTTTTPAPHYLIAIGANGIIMVSWEELKSNFPLNNNCQGNVVCKLKDIFKENTIQNDSDLYDKLKRIFSDHSIL